MINGIYSNPTTVYFGRDMEARAGAEVAKLASRALLLYGGASFRKYGLYERVTASLKSAGVAYIELGGVKPNPSAGHVYKGIELCRSNGLDLILAVGGGSVIDTAKAISIGVPWQGDFFDFYEGKRVPESALKVAAILTIPGSGIESNTGSVITHEQKGVKAPCAHPLMAPVFSILNPEVTCSLTEAQTSCGIVDAMSHVLERYFTNTAYVDCTDRLCEGLLKTLMKYAVLVRSAPRDYDVRAEIMWACKLAHDNTAGFGRKQDWSSHLISHELGALYDVPHGALMGVIFPAWLKFAYKANLDRFAQFADRVFDIGPGGSGAEPAALGAIAKFERFLRDIQMPATLRELGIREKDRFPEIARNCVRPMPSGTIGNFVRLAPPDIVNILEMAY